MSDRPAPPVTLLAYGEDPLAALADRILGDHLAVLPDLGQVAVILPHAAAAGRLRRLLLERAAAHDLQALLPPWVGTLLQWVTSQHPPAAPLLSQAAREVLLYDAIADHPDLCGADDRWALAENLLRLFDDLARNHHRLDADADGFCRELARAYGVNDTLPGPLQGEAELLQRLWQAWREHVSASGRRDPGEAYADALRCDAGSATAATIYIAGLWAPSARELAWLRSALGSGRSHLLVQGNGGGHGYNPETPVQELLDALGAPAAPAAGTDLDRFLSAVYSADDDPIMLRRAQALAGTCPTSPALQRILSYAALDAEQEAQAVELQVRRWWLDGCRHIGIVTNDRKLARRVRALLERARIQLQDGAGWRLSTTSAATALMRLLDCVERRFHCAALLDLLKSPFFAPPGMTAAELESARLILERELVLEGRIQEGLSRYRARLDAVRPHTADRYGAAQLDRLHALLDLLEAATGTLAACHDRHLHPLGGFLDALQDALERLGIWNRYLEDAAGQRLLGLLTDMQRAAAEHGGRRLWREFRGWLTRQLEGHNFQPALAGEGVELMGFGESRLYAFDAVVIAGANSDQLPGNLYASPFFNDAVRAELGLAGAREARNLMLYDFRRLLQSAPRVLITRRREQDGEPLLPSPWLERLQGFHELAYACVLHDDGLGDLLASTATRIRQDTGSVRPMPAPRPQPAAALLPRRISASAYQRLVDCPYRYYAYDCLGLADTPELKDELEKSDYGLHVHRILQRFASRLGHDAGGALPPLAEQDRLLHEISTAEFAGVIGQDFAARAWYYRWTRLIPDYLRWENARRVQWQVAETEAALQRDIGDDPGIGLHGRFDRIDRCGDEYAIVDYKTGAVAGREEVDSGENVQLPFYALLLGRPVSEARFVQFEDDQVRDKLVLEAATLQTLVSESERRLLQLQRALAAGAELPAWGDEQTCARCRLGGLCRRQYWIDAAAADTP